jgi:hypothetical protein
VSALGSTGVAGLGLTGLPVFSFFLSGEHLPELGVEMGYACIKSVWTSDVGDCGLRWCSVWGLDHALEHMRRILATPDSNSVFASLSVPVTCTVQEWVRCVLWGCLAGIAGILPLGFPAWSLLRLWVWQAEGLRRKEHLRVPRYCTACYAPCAASALVGLSLTLLLGARQSVARCQGSLRTAYCLPEQRSAQKLYRSCPTALYLHIHHSLVCVDRDLLVSGARCCCSYHRCS